MHSIETCQSQRNVPASRLWCDLEAPFEYLGPKLKKELYRVRVPMCVDHARDLYNSLEPAFHEGVIIIQPIGVPAKVTTLCKNCGNSFRIEKVGDTFYARPAQYCTYCGTKLPEPARPDFNADYFEYLSREFNNMDQQLLHLLFDAWDDRKRYPRFRDYVNYVLKTGGL
jgi:hypothetical protein